MKVLLRSNKAKLLQRTFAPAKSIHLMFFLNFSCIAMRLIETVSCGLDILTASRNKPYYGQSFGLIINYYERVCNSPVEPKKQTAPLEPLRKSRRVAANL